MQVTVQQYAGRKVGVEKHNFKKGFEENEHAYIVEGVSWVSDSSARPYLRWRTRLGKFKARLSSNRSESESRNPGHAAGAQCRLTGIGKANLS